MLSYIKLRLPIIVVLLTLVAMLPARGMSAAGGVGLGGTVNQDNPAERNSVLQEYAANTWQSFLGLLYPSTGLAADNVNADTRERARYTSPTNIGAYMWSTLAARDAGIISPSEARDRLGVTLNTLQSLERHQYSGMFYNWYDPQTGQKLTVWPPSGDPVYPFLSTVDNGWLAMALLMVSNAVPQLHDQAYALYQS